MNADEPYVPDYLWGNVRLHTDSRFTWLIDSPTNVKANRAYDR